MKLETYEIFRKYLSFQNDITQARDVINKIPSQTSEGNSKIGYMSQELSDMKSELNLILDKYLAKVLEMQEAL